MPEQAGLPNELPPERRELEGLRAHQLREEAGIEAPGLVGRPAQGVLVQVCQICGKEYLFDWAEPSPELTCDRCGNRVFRSFFDVAGYDEVEADFRASTERDLAPDDTGADVTGADILDLNNL